VPIDHLKNCAKDHKKSDLEICAQISAVRPELYGLSGSKPLPEICALHCTFLVQTVRIFSQQNALEIVPNFS
jgi:hypothetical protein